MENPTRDLGFLDSWWEGRKILWLRTIDQVWWGAAAAGYEYTQRELNKKSGEVKGLSDMASWVRMKLGQRVTGIIETTKQRVRTAAAAVNPIEAVKKLFNDMIKGRAAFIGEQEVHWAEQTGSWQAAQDFGARYKTWVTMDDHLVRGSHDAQNGVEILLDDVYPNGCRYPGDPSARPEEYHGCRCFQTYR